MQRQLGSVVWFSAKKGYGFIKNKENPDQKDIFVHWSGLKGEGYKQLVAGQTVEYELKETPKGVVATEVEVIS